MRILKNSDGLGIGQKDGFAKPSTDTTNLRIVRKTMKLFSTLLFALFIILLIYLFEQSYFTLPGFLQAGVFVALLYFFTEHFYEAMKTEEPMVAYRPEMLQDSRNMEKASESGEMFEIEGRSY